MRRAGLLAAALVLCAGPAFAAHWTVDAAKSKLGFALVWSGAPFDATFKSWKADIDFDPADLAHAHMLATIATASETSGDADTDDSLKGAKGFLTGHFPTATFEAKSFRHAGGDAYVADGTLTVRGVSRPLALPFTLKIDGKTAHVMGKAETRWAAFGMGQGMGAEAPPVGPAVAITLDLTATRAEAAR